MSPRSGQSRRCTLALPVVCVLAALVFAADASATRASMSSGTLTFFSQRTIGGGLYAESVAGGPLRQLVSETADSGVVWSPDGRRYLFMRAGTPDWESSLWISDADGGHRRLLADGDVSQPSWSPDGKRIAIRRGNGISIARVSDGFAHALTRPGDWSDGSPRWSPDGRLIAFLRAAPPGTTGASLLMAVRPNGTGLRRIAARAFYPPSWSPDGTHIAFVSSGPRNTGPFQPRAYAASTTGGQLRLLEAAQQDAPPAWSPDGRWIAVVDGTGETLSVVRPDGTGLHPLFGPVYYAAPAWSPDSRRLAVTSQASEPGASPTGSITDVWVVGLGGAARRITQGWQYGYSSYAPSWRPATPRLAQLGGAVVSPAIPTDSLLVDGVLETTEPVASLAVDGAPAAITYGPSHVSFAPDAPAGGVETWNPVSGTARFNTWTNTPPLLAIAGDQLAWSSFEHMMGTNSYGIATATVERPAPVPVTGICPSSSQWLCIRGPVGDVVGRGSLLVFDSWTGPEPYCNLPCPPPKRDGRLFRIDGGTAVQIASSDRALTPLAVDGDRILVDHDDSTLQLYRSDGTPLQTIDNGSSPSGAALDGNDVVALNDGVVDHYNATTGARVGGFTVAADATLAGLANGIVATVAATTITLTRVGDGHTTTIDAVGDAPVHARLDTAGLFYSWNVNSGTYPGRVAFIPTDQLPLR